MNLTKNTLEKIVADLDDLKNLIDFFSTQEDIPAIEIDIVKRKLQDIYLLFSDVSENPDQSQNTVKKETTKEISPEPVFEIEKEKKENDISEPQVEMEKEIPVENRAEEKKESPKPAGSKATLSDKLKGNNMSLNERLSGNKGSDLSSRLKKGPIKDLNVGIGLNEKFTYIKTLFGGDAHRFREAIDDLNTIQTLAGVEDYISSNFEWDMEDPVTMQFLDLIQRKLQNNG